MPPESLPSTSGRPAEAASSASCKQPRQQQTGTSTASCNCTASLSSQTPAATEVLQRPPHPPPRDPPWPARRTRRHTLISPLLLLTTALVLLLFQQLPDHASATEINSAVPIFGPWDYELRDDGSNTSRCTDMVDRVAQLPNSRVMFLPTLFWVSNHNRDAFVDYKRNDADYFAVQRDVEYYCYNQQYHRAPLRRGEKLQRVIKHYVFGMATEAENGASSANYLAHQHRYRKQICPPASQAEMRRYRQAMTVCFQRVVDHNLSIAVSPRLDDGLGLGGWRNGLIFDPLKKHEGMSYADMMIYPLAQAINAVMTQHTKVWFSLQGEMSATVIYNPREYTELIHLSREALLEGHPPEWAANINIGIQMNYNKICACVPNDIDATDKAYPKALMKLMPQFNLPAIAGVFNVSDFVGISSYPSLRADFDIRELEHAVWSFEREIKYFGIDLYALIYDHGKELHWTEYGVGGGACQSGSCKATSAEDAAEMPYYGLWGPYRRDTDPWELWNPDPPETREYLWYFYNQTAKYLSTNRHRFAVDGLFLWSTGSWDVQAIYPESTTTEGSYFDPVVHDIIRRHNLKTRAFGNAFRAPGYHRQKSMKMYRLEKAAREAPQKAREAALELKLAAEAAMRAADEAATVQDIDALRKAAEVAKLAAEEAAKQAKVADNADSAEQAFHAANAARHAKEVVEKVTGEKAPEIEVELPLRALPAKEAARVAAMEAKLAAEAGLREAQAAAETQDVEAVRKAAAVARAAAEESAAQAAVVLLDESKEAAFHAANAARGAKEALEKLTGEQLPDVLDPRPQLEAAAAAAAPATGVQHVAAAAKADTAGAAATSAPDKQQAQPQQKLKVKLSQAAGDGQPNSR